MVKVCINGGSVAGLTTALLLAQDGHDVTVVDRDEGPAHRDPRASWTGWRRRSVRQFRQTHAFLSRSRQILMDELPHVWARLLEAGVSEYDLVAGAPPSVGPIEPAPGDEDLVLLVGRRCTVEHVLHHAADDDPRIALRRGSEACGPRTDGRGRVTGLDTDRGPIAADVVVDCAGARTPMPDWVEAMGAARPSEDTAPFRIAYWTQWFRLRPGRTLPPMHGLPVTTLGSVQLLQAPGDHGWHSMTVVAPASERRYRALADPEVLLRVLRSNEHTRAWADPDLAEPAGEILPMFTPLDSRRRYVVDGEPCVAGLTGVGDAVASTNPSRGRGVTMAAVGAVGLRDVLRHVEHPAGVTVAHDAWMAEHIEPVWRETVQSDRALLEQMQSVARGDRSAPTDPASLFRHAAAHDPTLWRALLRIVGMLARPAEVLADPEVGRRLEETLARVGPPPLEDLDLEAATAA